MKGFQVLCASLLLLSGVASAQASKPLSLTVSARC